MKKYICLTMILTILLTGFGKDNSSDESVQSSNSGETRISVFSDAAVSEMSETEIQTEAASESITEVTEPAAPEYLTEEQKLYAVNGLEFLMDIDDAKALMCDFNIVSEDKSINDSGEALSCVEYENVELYGENFNLILCFKNMKLTALEYYMTCSGEESLDLYEEITAKVREIYPGRARGDRVITSWYNPLGEDTEIYVLNNETSIAVSFQLRDTYFDETKREPFVTAEGLEFFMDTDTVTELMNGYNILYDETENINRVIVYENVELYGESFNLSLNFKNRKLTRLDYIMNCSAGETSQKYEEMIIKVKEKYGKCYSMDNYMAMWNNVPSGENSFIYVFKYSNDIIKVSIYMQ